MSKVPIRLKEKKRNIVSIQCGEDASTKVSLEQKQTSITETILS